ncbi:hypothetical protein KSP40_PGU018270 [Platanthera guangdongensis]|uniref:Uncharacterized protein n=1 Tax=Platanthera guangdongensis TaxID=2320717 RepID=A0ABR2LUN4_9ASPA
MVAELDGGEFWLPAEFFNDDFNKEGNRSLAVKGGLFTEAGSVEEDHNSELIRRLAHTFLYEGSGFSASSYKVQKFLFFFFLCLFGLRHGRLSRFPFMKISATETTMWPILSREGPNSKRPAPMPSSPATSPARRDIDEFDFLYAAAWEVMRLKQVEHKFNGRRIPFTRFMSIPSLTHQQLQLYQLKRQQLIKQQLASAWNCQSRSAWLGGSRTNTAVASPPLLSQLPKTGMKAVQIDVRGNRRPSAGTGVFLPKREDIPSEALKKPASFTVLPARGSPTAKLKLDDAGFRPPCAEGNAVDYGKLFAYVTSKSHRSSLHAKRGRINDPSASAECSRGSCPFGNATSVLCRPFGVVVIAVRLVRRRPGSPDQRS